MKIAIPERQAEFRELLEKGAKVYAIRHKVLKGIAIKEPGKKVIVYMRSKDPSYEEALLRYMKQQWRAWTDRIQKNRKTAENTALQP